MVEINTFTPSVVAKAIDTSAVPVAVTESQYAQERFLATSTGTANPNFALTKDRNRLVENGGSISRGYIRRSDIVSSDPTSSYRLYFMYNPDQIQRSYISYLDQQALDPGNAVFGSNNMVAAPGILDFGFELLFDRQLEVAQDPTHPGTKVDYDYFDLVVRGVVPDSQDRGNAIPDNGIMMVNPHNIVVVFGQDLSVQGRVTNAAVNFEKFNNRMIPTRLRIDLQMKALYIGTVQTIPNYSLFVSEVTSQATISYEQSINVTMEQVAIQFATSKLKPPNDTTDSNFGNLFNGAKVVSGSTDETSFAKNMLVSLGYPTSQPNMNFIIAWERAEGGMPHNNPLNTTQDMPGATNFNSVGVKTYPNLDVGLQATVITITNGQYPGILSALSHGTSECVAADALAASPWGTGTLVQQILKCGGG
jgi:hypothetical protein